MISVIKQSIIFRVIINIITSHSHVGQWRIQTKDKNSEEIKTEVYEGVLLCTGHHAEKKLPDFEGRRFT